MTDRLADMDPADVAFWQAHVDDARFCLADDGDLVVRCEGRELSFDDHAAVIDAMRPR